MLKVKKIFSIVLSAALVGTFAFFVEEAAAQALLPEDGSGAFKQQIWSSSVAGGTAADYGKGELVKTDANLKAETAANTTAEAEKQAADVPAGTSDTQSASAVTGCSSDYGLFSGLIKTGRDVFNGLRDLIYVVAGFGIIGVAVGGFFGNLNWKWLGAIIIALVVIATTGEIINMITGCDKFTQAMITDTLK